MYYKYDKSKNRESISQTTKIAQYFNLNRFISEAKQNAKQQQLVSVTWFALFCNDKDETSLNG